MNSNHNRANYGTLFWTFLKIGSTAFGGFMALISVVQNYVVERRQLLSHEEMLDGISLATVLPGPVAMNVVAYVGHKLRGGMGAFVCTVAVTIPTFIFILILSYGYFTWGEIPSVNRFFQGVIPAVAAIIVTTAWNMGRKNINKLSGYAIAGFSFLALTLVGGFFTSLAVITISGLTGYWLYKEPIHKQLKSEQNASGIKTNIETEGGKNLLNVTATPLLATYVHFFNGDIAVAFKMLYTFAGMSLFLFGGGFVFIPLIQEIVVDGYGWVTHKEFIDGIALGQVTPGPILISAAFIGYKMGGLLGATTATIGIFTPPAIVMIICSKYLLRVKNSTIVKASMKGIRSGVIGMILAAALVVAGTAHMHWISLLIFFGSIVALLRYRIEVAIIISFSGVMGLIMY
jgi:chromate transporter